MKYNIVYTSNGEPRVYCKCDMGFVTAQKMLTLWVSKYWDTVNECGKAYPNGKGFYPVTLAKIVEV